MITHWSTVFGLNCSTEKRFPTKDEREFDLKLINEEVEETYLASDDEDEKEYQDGLGDVLWTTVRAMLNAGIDPQKTIEAIYKSNMSKLCTTKEEAEETKETYLEKGILVDIVPKDDYYLIRRVSDGKTLKANSFLEPKFD